ncbi:MAG: LysR family transcriptional regulator [Hydrogenophilales bacterium]|nr:LysR family transcriptional regulator [Hydrogenophilales bacterium]
MKRVPLNVKMQFRHLKTFAAVASTLSFTRAAEQVHLVQSSVTEQIQALETELGTPLFDRSRRKLSLTGAGRRLLEYAEDILTLVDEARSAVADAAGFAAGSVAIGGLETICASRLPPLLAEFSRTHPSIALQLKVATSGELRNAVRRGALDVCFAFGDVLSNDDLCSEVVSHERLAVIAPLGHWLAECDAIEPNDMAGEDFLVTEAGCVYRQMFESAFPVDRPGRPRVAGEFNSITAIRRLVETGLGCAIVPSLVVSESETGLIVRPWLGEARSVPIAMSWRRRRVQPTTLSLFLDAARASLGAIRSDVGRHRRAEPSP